MMLSDETFPKDLIYEEDEEEREIDQQQREDESVKFSLNHETSKSIDNFASYLSSSSANDESTGNSLEMERLIKSSDFENMTESSKFGELNLNLQQPEASFKSMNASSQKTSILPPPCAPIKKKKSFSCHDLQQKKHKYDHVESKVKKLIANLAEDRRRNTLMRHTSMPVCPQTPMIDEKSSDEEFESKDLKRELRKKSIKIYELEEKCDMKDNQIYQLECERSKMKMTFDKLRTEMQELKEIENQYKQLKHLTSPNKTLLKNAQMQTEDSGFDESSKLHLTTTGLRHNLNKNANRLLSSGAIRQLAFDNSTNMNQSHFAETNNTSSDNLIPTQDPFLEEIDLTPTAQNAEAAAAADTISVKKTKKPKFRRFFRLVPCIFRNK
jgi:hypothetical protein